jgi:chitin disaccharide deacetylase
LHSERKRYNWKQGLLFGILTAILITGCSSDQSGNKPASEMRKELKNRLKKTILNISSGSIQKKLGYPADVKLLIIHADDMGLSDSENSATIEAMSRGLVNSGSIMVPCPGFNSAAEYIKANEGMDIGVHLTLTSEWSKYKFGPVLPVNEVPSIADENGFFYGSSAKLYENADPDDVEKELRAQINKAIESGIDITHVDSHMFSAFTNQKILEKYISLGGEFKLPVLLTYDMPLHFIIPKNSVVVDRLFIADNDDYAGGLGSYYTRVLKSLNPGLNCILLHVAFNNDEMQSITGGQKSFGSEWRQADFDFFTGDECRQLIKENNIQLITWREIRDKLLR